MKPVDVQLLGPVAITQGDEDLTPQFESRKALALFCYLASAQKPVSRVQLVDLFWPDKPEKRGRGNLSRVLSNFSSILPDVVDAKQHEVAFCHNNENVRVDTAELEALIENNNIVSLDRASQLYRGAYLEGLYLEDCAEFEIWLTREQERWRQRATEVLEDLLMYDLHRREFTRARDYAERLLELNPWREESHRHLMLLYALTGERSLALAQFKKCREVLQAELEVDPEEETRALHTRILEGDSDPDREVKRLLLHHGNLLSPPSNLPSLSAPLLGRERESEQIAQLLNDAGCRILTLVGLGGAGKTYLALHMAKSMLANFKDGVYFVPLAHLTDTAQLPQAIADAVQLQFSGAEEPREQVLGYLADKELLLVIDNVEHLLECVPWLIELHGHAPHVKLLVTSREPLNIQDEHVLRLDGLASPSSSTTSDLSEFGAVALFAHKAKQVDAAFALDESSAEPVAEICQLLEGLPLALDMAASWVQTLSPAEILREIQSSEDFLTAQARDIDARHSSLRAVFEYSWDLMRDAERALLAKVSVFHGGFTREALDEITGSGLQLLTALVNKSLVRRLQYGRFDMHELLREFAARKLSGNSEREARAREAHAGYFLQWLASQLDAVRGPNQAETLDQISQDLANIRAAWEYAVEQHRHDWLLDAHQTLHLFFAKRSRYDEALELFGETQRGVAQQKPTRSTSAAKSREQLLCQLGSRHGYFLYTKGRFDEAREALESCLARCQETGFDSSAAFCHNSLGAIDWYKGDYESAEAHYEESLRLYREIEDSFGTAMALNNLGMLKQTRGDLLGAQALYEQRYELGKETDDLWGMAYALTNLASSASLNHDYKRAQKLLKECIALRRAIRDRHGEAVAFASMGETSSLMGDHAAAKGYFEQSERVYNEIGDSVGFITDRILYARCLLRAYELDEAQEQLRFSLKSALEHELMPLVYESLAGWMILLSQSDEPSLALRIAAYLLQQENVEAEVHHDAEELRDELINAHKDLAKMATLGDSLEAVLGEIEAWAKG